MSLKPETIVGLVALIIGCVMFSVGISHLYLHQDPQGVIGFTSFGGVLAVFGAFLLGYSIE